MMRCLNLANSLKNKGHNCYFFSKNLQGNINQIITENKISLITLEAISKDQFEWLEDVNATIYLAKNLQIDWFILDHYEINLEWQKLIKKVCKKTMIIDDLANKKYYSDVILNQNLISKQAYLDLTLKDCKLFIGPEYALINSSFDNPRLRNFSEEKINLLIYLGSNDIYDQISKAIEASLKFTKINCIVITGINNPHNKLISKKFHDHENLTILNNTENMSEYMNWADLAIGTCGISAWERCAMALPTIACITAENQRKDAEELFKLGAIHLLGDAENISVKEWHEAINLLVMNKNQLKKMTYASHSVMLKHNERKKELINYICEN